MSHRFDLMARSRGSRWGLQQDAAWAHRGWAAPAGPPWLGAVRGPLLPGGHRGGLSTSSSSACVPQLAGSHPMSRGSREGCGQLEPCLLPAAQS